MVVSAIAAAKELYHAAKCDPSMVAQIRSAYQSSVSAGLLTKSGLDMIVNASKNGSTLTVMNGLSELDRIKALRYALQWLNAGSIPSSGRALARF